MRYQVVGKSGKIYGTFPNHALAYQYLHNTYPTYTLKLRSRGNESESLNDPVLPEIMMVLPVRRKNQTENKSDWDRLLELAQNDVEENEELIELRNQFGSTKEKMKSSRTKVTGVNVKNTLSGQKYTFISMKQAAEYFGVSYHTIQMRVNSGKVAKFGKVAHFRFSRRG